MRLCCYIHKMIYMLHAPARLALATMAMLAIFTGPLRAAELVLFERAGCVWCDRWNSEIGLVYDKIPEGQVAPLRRVHVDRMRPPEPALASAVIYTPTFVVIDNGREIGRITGYSGNANFWGLLGRILAGMPKREALLEPAATLVPAHDAPSFRGSSTASQSLPENF